jgi:hypothetical protein
MSIDCSMEDGCIVPVYMHYVHKCRWLVASQPGGWAAISAGTLKADCSVFHSGRGSSALCFLDSSSKLLLF